MPLFVLELCSGRVSEVSPRVEWCYLGIETTSASPQQAVEISRLCPVFLPRISGLMLLEMRQEAGWLLTYEGMVTAF